MKSHKAHYLSKANKRRRHRAIVGIGLFAALAAILIPSYLTQHPLNGQRTTEFYFQRLDGGTLYPNLPFTVELRVKTHGQAINAVSTAITLDPKVLEIMSITTEDSFCSLYADNSFDTIKGEVTVSCGTPSPGFGGDSPIVAIKLRAKVPGTAQLLLDPKQDFALANDGKGTDILRRPLPSFPLVIKQTF